MTRSTIKLSTIGAAFAIGAAVFAGQASSAVRDSRSPDTRDAAVVASNGTLAQAYELYVARWQYAAAHPYRQTLHGRSSGTRDTAVVPSSETPAVALEQFFAAHPESVILDGRSPDTRDSAYAEQLAVDGRSPDTRDAAGVVGHPYGQTRTPAEMIALHFKHEDALYRARALASGPPRSATATEVGASDGFDWGDAGIGAISGLGVSILLLGGALVLLRRRGEPVSTATS